MSRRHLFMRTPLARTALVATCCAAALVLAGCAAGQVTQTDTQAAAVDGATADIGTIAMRDVLIPYPEDGSGAYPAGSDVPVQLTIVNQGDVADTLVSASSPVASRVLIEGNTTLPGGMSVFSRGEPVGTTSSASSHGRTTTSPSAEPSATATPSLSSGTAGGQGDDSLDIGEVRIVLVDIKQPIRAGLNTDITFVFRNAGSVTLPVPVGSPTDHAREPLEEHGEH